MAGGPKCVDYYAGWVDNADQLFDVLRDHIAWEQHTITLYGRSAPTPRLTAWMADSTYRYSGIANEPAPWSEALAELREQLRNELGVDFNSCLANLYRDGSDSVGYHSDDEPELGPRPTIASISLGDRRRFVLRHRRPASDGAGILATVTWWLCGMSHKATMRTRFPRRRGRSGLG
jgi:alkylated DNA repair dioxygenase AlkB